jgi:hypothetical protein
MTVGLTVSPPIKEQSMPDEGVEKKIIKSENKRIEKQHKKPKFKAFQKHSSNVQLNQQKKKKERKIKNKKGKEKKERKEKEKKKEMIR